MSPWRWPGSMLLSSLWALMIIFLANTASEAASLTRTETFDSGLGNFNSSNGNTSGGNNFAWSNTDNAGGPAGEVGGTFARTDGITNAFIADTDLGGVLSKGEDLVISGTLHLNNISWNGSMFVGYFNTAIDSKASMLGLIIEEPSGRPEEGFRMVPSVNDQHGGNKQPIGFQNTPLDFSLTWDASASGDGSGTLSGTVGDFAMTPATIGAGAWEYDAFGVGAGGVDGSDSSVLMNAYVDNLTYSIVPEPVALTLFGLGIGMGLVLLHRQRP